MLLTGVQLNKIPGCSFVTELQSTQQIMHFFRGMQQFFVEHVFECIVCLDTFD
jgi:hypothetical protein